MFCYVRQLVRRATFCHGLITDATIVAQHSADGLANAGQNRPIHRPATSTNCFMATIGGVRGDASATESVRRDGRSELNGRIRIRSDDYPRVGDWLTTFEPVEYRGPIERDGKRTTESRSVVLRRVDAHDGSEVSVYFENAERGASGDTLCTPSGDRVFTGVAGSDGQT